MSTVTLKSKEGKILTPVKQIIKPEDITQEFIEKRPVSYSSLKHFMKSPKHYIEYLNTEKKKDAYTLGNAIECLALEADNFNKKFEVYKKFDKRSSAAKEKWALMVETAKINKKELITEEQVEASKMAVDSLYSVKQSREILGGAYDIQKKLSWRDKKTNLPLKGIIDFKTNWNNNDWIVDLKTGDDVEPEKFLKDFFKWGYNYQVGSYKDAYQKKFYQFPDFIYLAVETTPPYCVSVNFIESSQAEAMHDEFISGLVAFKFCMDNQLFHQGYEFRLQSKDYFSIRYPGYYKPKYL